MALITWNQCARKRIPRLSVFILAAWLSCCVRGSSGQLSIIPDPPVARVGQNVTLSLYINHTLNAATADWYKGLAVSGANRILRYIFATKVTTTGTWYSGKETALPDGSLRITDVWRNHTGPYTVEIQFMDFTTREASVDIGVYDVLTAPTLVNASGSGFSGDNLTLDCQAWNQTVERYTFFKDTKNVTCDQQRIHCSEGNSVLSFQPTKESDSGNYTCTIHNPVSFNSSLPLVVRVKAAPISNVIITSNMSSGQLWENEDSVQLNCTAQGTDPVFSWMFYGSALTADSRYTLSASNSSLTISPVTREDTRPFHCTASNSANNESSAGLNLTISWRPNGSMICGATNISDDIQFSCSWPGGNPPASVQMLLPPIVNESSDSEVSHSMSRDNITTNMTLSCNGSQEARTSLCSLNLGLPHHPNFETTNSSRPTEGEAQSLIVNLGQGSSTRVSSVQILPATFAWSHGSSSIPDSNDKLMIVSDTTFSNLTIYKVTVNDSGDYNCLVQNLMGSTTFSFLVNVQPAPETTASTTTTTTTTTIKPNDSSGSGGLSAGAIAGIVIGAVALAVIIGVTIFCVLKNKKGKNYGSNSSSEGTRSNQGDPNAMPMNDSSRNGDINYADLSFNQTQQATPPADYPGASETLVYAQVKRN